ncbi:transcription factor Zelda-like [Cloeon dipterum]|uniref:transcription factor Zelda-like n=1 Tax=Cloeon dipterum TaxID=197152 RepID=UPI00321FAB3B
MASAEKIICEKCDLHLDTITSYQIHLRYQHKENLPAKWIPAQHHQQHHLQASPLPPHDEHNNNSIIEHAKGRLQSCVDEQHPSPLNRYSPQSEGSPSSMQAVASSTTNTMRSPGNNTNGFYMEEPTSSTPFTSEYTNGGGPMRDATASGGIQRFMPYNNTSMQHQQPLQRHAAEMMNEGCWDCGLTVPPHAMMAHKCSLALQQQQPQRLAPQGEENVSPGSSASLDEQFLDSAAQQPPMPPRVNKESSEILDLDSHKVLIYQQQMEAEKRRMKSEFAPDTMFGYNQDARQPNSRMNGGNMAEYAPHHPMQPPNMMGYHQPPAPTMMDLVPAYLHPQAHPPLPMQPQVPQITPHQQPPPPSGGGVQQPPSGGNQSWKSNEARRPKTYNCPACNKWFTSSGHLKRHYNTTLHKNAIKQSGGDPLREGVTNRPQPPAHHNSTTNDSTTSTGNTSSPVPSLGEESSSRSDDNTPNMLPPVHPQSNASSPPNREAGLLESPASAALELSTPGGLHLPPTPSPSHSSSHSSSNSPHPPPHSSHTFTPLSSTTNHCNSNNHPNRNSPTTNSHSITNNNSRSSNNNNNINNNTVTSTSNHHPHPQGNNCHLPAMPMEALYPRHPPPDGLTQQVPQYSQPGIASSMVAAPLTAPSTTNQNHWYNQGFYNGDNVPTGSDASDNWYTTGTANQLVPLPSFARHFSQYDFTQPQTATGDSWNSSLPYTNTSDNSHDSVSDQQMSSPLTASTPSPCPTSTVDDQMLRSRGQSMPSRGRGRGRGRGRPPLASSGEKHRCELCDKDFNRACYLTQHNKSFHDGEKPYKCTKCGKRFDTASILFEHSEKHKGDKPHKCHLCPKQFNHKTDLRRHECLHSGEKPYTCNTCGKGFIRKDHMLKHSATHFTESRRGKKPKGVSMNNNTE